MDAIAMSYLCKELSVSHDLFEDIMISREDHCRWFCDLILEQYYKYHLPIFILGYSFKAESSITTGSYVLLLLNLLYENYGFSESQITKFDPYIEGGSPQVDTPHVFFIGMNHKQFQTYTFPKGSVVLDPHGFIQDQPGVKVIRIGRSST